MIRKCSDCGYEETKIIPASGHEYLTDFTVDKSPTCIDNGEKSIHCIKCDYKAEITVLPKTNHMFGAWENIVASNEKIRKKTCSICGFTETESLVLKDPSNTEPNDKIPNNAGPEPTIKNPSNDLEPGIVKGTKIKQIISKKNSIIVKWKKIKGGIAGYHIQLSKKRNFISAKKIIVSKNKNRKTITKLKGKREYFIRIRTYKIVSNKNYYSLWSKPKRIVIK